MKEPQDSVPPRWQALVAEARRDQPPDLDPQAVLVACPKSEDGACDTDVQSLG